MLNEAVNQPIEADIHPSPAGPPAKQEKPTKSGSLWKWGAGAAAVSALAATAVYNQLRARQAEADNPPLGDFLEVDGVELHYLESGEGDPIVLLHGNGAMAQDWVASGLLDQLALKHRVIAFDRPGFGHSERPRSTIWTAEAQAKLIARALDQLGIEKPLVVGHSWGTLVTLALALDHRERVGGIVLLGGYYYPSVRGDVLFASPPAVPGIGDVMRYTVSPLLGAAMSPAAVKKVFSPAPVPESFAAFPLDMSLRPSQIRASAAEAALMIPAAASLSPRYAELDLPVTVVAGAGDLMVTPEQQTQRFADALPQAKLRLIEGAGHMVHYTATDEVAQAIEEAWPHRHG
jgi:pimeloyl-ACP methyl ester carboxylesterase